MANTKLRDGFTIPMPKPGDGTKLMLRPDGSLYCSWDRPAARMALDAALGAQPTPDYGPDEDSDLEFKVRQLLSGKLEPADLDALCNLIFPDDTDTAAPAQDRRRRGMATDELRRHVSTSLARRARVELADLTARFPALANARVVG